MTFIQCGICFRHVDGWLFAEDRLRPDLKYCLACYKIFHNDDDFKSEMRTSRLRQETLIRERTHTWPFTFRKYAPGINRVDYADDVLTEIP